MKYSVEKMFWALLIAIIAFFLFAPVSCRAEGLTFGVHLASTHIPARPEYNNVNPGLYLRTAEGLTLGAYRNSYRRTSVYAGWTFERGPFAFTVGATTGYRKRSWDQPCPDGGGTSSIQTCRITEGETNGYLAPILSPSVRLPAVAGFTPRLSYVPSIGAGSSVFHLSIEKEWK